MTESWNRQTKHMQLMSRVPKKELILFETIRRTTICDLTAFLSFLAVQFHMV
jgi:hypothetical protein